MPGLAFPPLKLRKIVNRIRMNKSGELKCILTLKYEVFSEGPFGNFYFGLERVIKDSGYFRLEGIISTEWQGRVIPGLASLESECHLWWGVANV